MNPTEGSNMNKKSNSMLKLTALSILAAAMITTLAIGQGLGAQPSVKVNVYQRYSSAGPHTLSKSSPTYLAPRTAMDFANASMDVTDITLPDHEIWDEQGPEDGTFNINRNYTSFSFYCPYNATLENVSIRFTHSGTTYSVAIRLMASYYNIYDELVPDKNGKIYILGFLYPDSNGWFTLASLNTQLLTNNTNASTWFIRAYYSDDTVINCLYYTKDDTNDDNHIVAYQDNSIMMYRYLIIDGSTIDVQAKVGLKPLDSTPAPSDCNLKINNIPVTDGSDNSGSWFTDTMPPTLDEYYRYSISADWFDYSLNFQNIKQYHRKMNVSGGQLSAITEWGVTTGWKHDITLGIFSSQCGNYMVEYEIPSGMQTPLVFRGGSYQPAIYSTEGGVTKVLVAGADGHYTLTFEDPVSAAALPMVKIGVFAGIGGGVAAAAVFIVAKLKKKNLKPYLE